MSPIFNRYIIVEQMQDPFQVKYILWTIWGYIHTNSPVNVAN